MFCPNCGAEIPDNSVVCSNCGTNLSTANNAQPEVKGFDPNNQFSGQQPQYGQQAQYSQPQYGQPQYGQQPQYQGYNQYPAQAPAQSDGLGVAIKVLAVICAVLYAFTIIGLAWAIPMTIHCFKVVDNGEEFGVGFKICSILFLSPILGILMFIRDANRPKYYY